MKYKFAFSQYDYNNKQDNNLPTPTYYGVRNDGTILKSTNWTDFYNETREYCDGRLELFCKGYLTANPDTEIYTHKRTNDLFTIDFKALTITYITDDEITYYDEAYEPDPERIYKAMFQ